jgi:uncharacterized membrane protein
VEQVFALQLLDQHILLVTLDLGPQLVVGLPVVVEEEEMVDFLLAQVVLVVVLVDLMPVAEMEQVLIQKVKVAVALDQPVAVAPALALVVVMVDPVVPE